MSEELEAAKAELKEAGEKIKKLDTELKTLQTQKKSKYFYKEKKFSKFDGSGTEDVRDWGVSMLKYVDARFDDEAEKIEFIIDHLKGNPKTEIKFRARSASTQAKDVIQMLIDVFGDRDRAPKLLQNFYSREQQKEESLEDYSYALIELLTKMDRLEIKQAYNPDVLLKGRFASGVLDIGLRREMQRLNEEHPSMKFHQFREKALRWTEEDPKYSCSKTEASEGTCSKQETTDVLQMMTKQQAIIQEQQKQLAQVSESLKRLSSSNSYGTYRPRGPNTTASQPSKFQSGTRNMQNTFPQREPIVCHYCKQPNHYLKDCLLLKEKEKRKKMVSTRNSQQEADVEEFQEQSVENFKMSAQMDVNSEDHLNEGTF